MNPYIFGVYLASQDRDTTVINVYKYQPIEKIYMSVTINNQLFVSNRIKKIKKIINII